MTQTNMAKRGDYRYLLSIDGISVLTMFPDRQFDFPMAQWWREQSQQSTGWRKK
jgi:hypothetical protein